MPSFTTTVPNLVKHGPVVELIIAPSQLYLKNLGIVSNIPSIKVMALIDTGASVTVIQQGIAQQLKIPPVSQTVINTPSSTKVPCFQYDVQVVFPNNLGIGSLVVTEAPLQGQDIQCLIGRDILSQCVLVYIGYNNTFTLSL